MAARKPRGPSARVVLHRARVARVELAVADGISAVGRRIVDTANPPDAPPFGIGLVRNGGYLTYVDRMKTDGFGLDGRQPRAPRGVLPRTGASGGPVIQCIIGFGFPARFQEFGTVHHDPQPFFVPAVQQVLPQFHAIITPVVHARLARIP